MPYSGSPAMARRAELCRAGGGLLLKPLHNKAQATGWNYHPTTNLFKIVARRLLRAGYNWLEFRCLEAAYRMELTLNPSVDGEIGSLLQAWSDGDRNALEKFTPIVYEELRQARAPLHAQRARQHHPADHGPGQRGLSAAGGLQAHALQRPSPLLCRVGAIDEANPGGSRAAKKFETRRRNSSTYHWTTSAHLAQNPMRTW
jgi:hypothetical protein